MMMMMRHSVWYKYKIQSTHNAVCPKNKSLLPTSGNVYLFLSESSMSLFLIYSPRNFTI